MRIVATETGVAEHALHIPAVPLHQMMQRLAAGTGSTYAELLDALLTVGSLAVGREVWVRARNHQLAITTIQSKGLGQSRPGGT